MVRGGVEGEGEDRRREWKKRAEKIEWKNGGEKKNGARKG
jgi:hypothetical protein